LQKTQDDNKVQKHRVETMRDENDIVSQRLLEKEQEVDSGFSRYVCEQACDCKAAVRQRLAEHGFVIVPSNRVA